MTPLWIQEGEKYIGLREIPGKAHAPQIIQWLIKLNAWWRDDETPWCGLFVAFCLMAAGIPIPKHWYRAKAYLDWGYPIDAPCYGCIVVFTRDGGGHVGFVVGKDELGRLMVLGGNQKNMVSIAPFNMSRVAGYRMPSAVYYAPRALPIIASTAASSTNEA